MLNVHNTPYTHRNNLHVPDRHAMKSQLASGSYKCEAPDSDQDCYNTAGMFNVVALGKTQLRLHKVGKHSGDCQGIAGYEGGCYRSWTKDRDDTDSFVGAASGTTYTYTNTKTAEYYPPYAFPLDSWTEQIWNRVIDTQGFLQEFTVMNIKY